jgi:hypothetical protein
MPQLRGEQILSVLISSPLKGAVTQQGSGDQSDTIPAPKLSAPSCQRRLDRSMFEVLNKGRTLRSDFSMEETHGRVFWIHMAAGDCAS